jgi:AbrB family looped-hinge helix DNA binding protein
MEISKLSQKGQVTIPKRIRKLAGLKPGDMVAYGAENGVITMKRVEPFDSKFHAALSDVLEEWNSPEDDEAFRDL